MANPFKRLIRKLINLTYSPLLGPALVQEHKPGQEAKLFAELQVAEAASAAWRDRYVESLLRSADPRALRDVELSRRSPAQVDRTDVRQLVDSWKPTAQAKVSFVLPTYNRLGLLQLAVQSIRDQALPVPSEIIVVDGGSGDGTIEWLVRQEDIISIVQHNRVPKEDNRRRKSWGYFINVGFRVAQGKWICMISDDVLLLPGSVANGLRCAEALESQGHNIGGTAFYFRDWPKMDRYFVQHTLGGMLMVNHGLFLKEALIDVGYVEEELYSFYKADSDLSLKLWDAGYEIVACPDSFLEHLLLPSEELRMQNNQTLERDRKLMIARWSGRFHDPSAPELFSPPYQEFRDFSDEHGTAQLFSPFVATGDEGKQ